MPIKMSASSSSALPLSLSLPVKELRGVGPEREAQLARLSDQLRRSVGRRVSVDARVDPGLIGGMIVKLGSRMVDGSLRSKLQRLQLAMKGIG